MSYTRPLYDQATASWEGAEPYTRPDIASADASFMAGEPPGPADAVGAVTATLAAPTLPLSAALRERPAFTAPYVWAKLPVARSSATTAQAQGALVQSAVAAVTLPPPALPLIAIVRERAYTATAVVTLPPPVLPAPALVAHGDMVQTAACAITLPPPNPALLYAFEPASGGHQDIDLPERIESGGAVLADAAISGVTERTAQAMPHATARTVTQQQMLPRHAPAATTSAQMHPQHTGRTLTQSEMIRMRAALAERAQDAMRIVRGESSPHAEAIRTRTLAHERAHRAAARCVYGHRERYADAIRTRTRHTALHHHGAPCVLHRRAPHADTLRTHTPSTQRWQQGMPPPPGRWWPYAWWEACAVSFRGRPIYTRPAIDQADAQFAGTYTRPGATCRPGWQPIGPEPPPEPIIVPIRRIYLVVNTFSLVRAADGAPIHAATFRAGLARDAWCWSWSARIPADHLAQLRPDTPGSPVEVIATINGTPLRLLAERIQRDRRFGASWLNISGRSRSAYLADPYAAPEARTNADLRTAQQLLADALSINGVPLGWTVDWRITDWPVPAGAWSHTGTYIEAALRIAEAGGAYLQTHDTADTLIVLPQYPSAPWQWAEATPDLVLPEDVVEVEGIEWAEKPAYNAVWIAGGAGGRLDRVRRAGTNGDRPAQTVVDALATDPVMTRQRGLPVLADTGRQAHISLRLPVLQETGLIRPGALVRYTESGNTHHGLSRSVEVTMDYPQVWQTIQVETHESL